MDRATICGLPPIAAAQHSGHITLPLPGIDKVQLEAGTSCDSAHSSAPSQRLAAAESLFPPPPPPHPWNPCPALAWLPLRWGKREELQTLLLWQPSTPLGRKGDDWERRGPCLGPSLISWVLRREQLKSTQLDCLGIPLPASCFSQSK